MRRWLAVASLLFILAPVRAAQPQDPAQKLTKSFTQQEQILLAGLLADPQNAREFAKDAHSPATQAVFDKWRQRIALFSRQYLDGPHPVNESARSVKDMVSDAEWQMLTTSLRMLSDGGIADQANFRIFLALLKNANDDLKADPPDPRNAHKVINLGRSKVAALMKDYLSSPTGQAALAEALRGRQAPAPAQTAQAAPKPAAKPKPQTKALTQAETAADQMRVSAVAGSAESAGGKAFDGSSESASADEEPAGSADAAPPPPSVPVSVAALSALMLPTERPTLAVRLAPPSPSSGDGDLAELHARTKKVSGHKKWFAALGLGLVGAAVGFMIGGPAGATVLGVGAGVAGHRVGHYLWG